MQIIQRFKFLPVFLILSLLISVKSLAISQIDKNIDISPGTSHFLIFDEKILSYKFENEKNFKAEIITDIFNSKQELLIKPVKNLDNKLTVCTSSKIYNFKIKFNQNQSNGLPALTENPTEIIEFELDNPPKMDK